jgi:hypothetical protein
MARVIDVNTLKAEQRSRKYAVEMIAHHNGKDIPVTVEFDNGMIMNEPIITKEIITATGANALAERMVFAIETGRELLPRIYETIYDIRNNPNAPSVVKFTGAVKGNVVFIKRAEGEEVKFGSAKADDKGLVEMVTYSAGFAHTREMRIYTDSNLFDATEYEQATGEANNALLNNIHLAPIVAPVDGAGAPIAYPAANKQAAVTTGEGTDANTYLTLEAAIGLSNELNQVPGDFTTILANPSDRLRLERILTGGQISGTTYPSISQVDTLVYYKGWKGAVGDKEYSYPGVTAGKIYLIRTKRQFKSVIKEDMVIEMGSGDVTRGIDKEFVAHTTLAMYAAVFDNVIEITLP